MGHNVIGFIVQTTLAPLVSSQLPALKYAQLSQNFVLFPLTDDLLDDVFEPPLDFPFSEFTYLPQPLHEFLKQVSLSGDVVYFETNYHGGTGDQAAIVFRRGATAYGPTISEVGRPISDALQMIGVSKEGEIDEFQAIGLARFRSSERWLEDLGESE